MAPNKLSALVIAVMLSLVANTSSADDVNAAAKAFSQGQQAMMANDAVRAAEMFELADELAPSPPALRNAARARLAAGHTATAATLAAQLLQRYSNDKESRAIAEAILSDLAPKLTQIEITCSEDCTVTLDGKAASSAKPRKNHVLYAQPGARTVGASFEGDRQAKDQLTARAGTSHRLELVAPLKPAPEPVAPPPTVVQPTRVADSTGAPLREPVRPAPRGGLARKWVAVAAIVTVGFGVGATLQGLATLDTRDEIKTATGAGDSMRAQTLYDRGRDEQVRTNVLLGATAATGVATIVFAVLADWSGGESRTSLAISPTAGSGATFVLGGRF